MNTHLRYFLLLLLPLLLIALLLSGCQSAWHQPFPNAEIVYQTGLNTQKHLGFVNSDGTNLTILETGSFLRKPVWSADGNLIYGLADGIPSVAYTIGYPAFWDSNGDFKKCKKWGNWAWAEGSGNQTNLKEAIVHDNKTILLVDLAKCKKIRILLDYSNQGELAIIGVSDSPYYQSLLFGLEKSSEDISRTYQIMKMDLTTLQTVALAQGINPSWSPDGLQIAYVHADGLYIMKADGSQPRQLVRHTFVDHNDWFDVISPLPRWSPDGKWIIYHLCEQGDCMLDELTIYKVEVATGITVKIVERGAFPDWRK